MNKLRTGAVTLLVLAMMYAAGPAMAVLSWEGTR